MGLSLLGWCAATRAGVVRLPFTIALLFTPLTALTQKREMDRFEVSFRSKRPFTAELDSYPETKQAYLTVMDEADQEIKQLMEKRDELRAEIHKRSGIAEE